MMGRVCLESHRPSPSGQRRINSGNVSSAAQIGLRFVTSIRARCVDRGLAHGYDRTYRYRERRGVAGRKVVGMDFFFDPVGVAFIGATPKPAKTGFRILKNLTEGYKGPIYPVNPAYPEIEGLRCYASVLDVPDPVDLALIFTPAHTVVSEVRRCAERGIKGVIIQSAGFAEGGPEGRRMQEEMRRIARETGIRLWGPNCMGLVDATRRHVFSFVMETIWENGLIPGNISLIVQSGFLAAGFLVDVMSHATMGVSKACSIGNKVDVDECDLLEYLLEDPDTAVIGMYLESILDGRRFVDLCRKSTKPIVLLKGGRTAAGAKAALSHTASLAGNGALVRGALAQAGVIEATGFYQMFDMCRALAQFPNADSAGRVAVLSGSGGAGIVASDLLSSHGLQLAELSEATRESLADLYPEWMPVANPVDLFPAVDRSGPRAFVEAFRAVCADPNVDGVLFHLLVGGAFPHGYTLLAEMARAAGKPVFCWLMGSRDAVARVQQEAVGGGVPVFRELSRTVECLAAVLQRPPRFPLATEDERSLELSAESAELLRSGQGTLDEHDAKQVLSACGIPVVEEHVVADSQDAVRWAETMGFPVVLKGLSPDIVHKTERGLVRLGITASPDVAGQFEDLRRTMNGSGRVLLQRHVRGDLELIVGLVRDEQFGPCVMLGYGGVMAEVLGEPVFAVAPLSEAEAIGMLERLKPQALLHGFRGAEPVDGKAVAQILMRLGDLGLRYPQIREIDINPLIVTNGKPVAVDASVILERTTPEKAEGTRPGDQVSC